MNITTSKTALDFGPTRPAAKAKSVRVKIPPRIIRMNLDPGNVMDYRNGWTVATMMSRVGTNMSVLIE